MDAIRWSVCHRSGQTVTALSRPLPATALISEAKALTERAVDAYGILVSAVIPGTWMSEGFFTLVYDRLVKRKGDPPASVFLLGYDTAPIRGEKYL